MYLNVRKNGGSHLSYGFYIAHFDLSGLISKARKENPQSYEIVVPPPGIEPMGLPLSGRVCNHYYSTEEAIYIERIY